MPIRPDAVPPWDRRRSGVLLPLSALNAQEPGASMGSQVRRFLAFLHSAGFSVWQMLPIHPPDFYGSPYQSCSVHAGDPGLIDLMSSPDHETAGHGAYANFQERHRVWLEDFALFTGIRQFSGDRPWWEWPPGLRDRNPAALAEFRAGNLGSVEAALHAQFRFFSQWRAMRQAAAEFGILLFGDLPLFPAHDSADVWSHREYFQLDEKGKPRVVAGVPPDAFTAAGQCWGNPVYQWPAMAADGFHWWIERLRTQLELFDFVRLDHFRGLEAIWEIPADRPLAKYGEWRPAPGRDLLQSLRNALGRLPLVAEDLGTITAPVTALREAFGLPGMKVLQFAFDRDACNPYLPHNHERCAVVYTGTHDNNTTLGWYDAMADADKLRVLEYLGQPTDPMPWPLIRAALGSVCDLAMLPMQDLLALGAGHRTNTPGATSRNWQWQLPQESLTDELARRLRRLNEGYGRC